MDAFIHYSDILRAQVIFSLRRANVIIRLFKIHLAFGIFPYFSTLIAFPSNYKSGKDCSFCPAKNAYKVCAID